MKTPANNTTERFSVGSVTYGTKISEIRESLNSKFGKKTIDALIDTGRLRIVRNIEEAEAIGLDIKESKKNTITGYVVPDEFAHENNPEGIFATLKLKENLKFPSGKIIVKEGFYRLRKHRGLGAKHLTANAMEFPERNFYPDNPNVTEAALHTLKDVLSSSTRLFRENETAYVFYSKRRNRGIPCIFDEDKATFSVITDRPVRPTIDVERLWGNDSVRLSGALIFPDHDVSVTPPSSGPNIGENQTEPQLTTSHKDLYTDVDYTQEISDELEKIDYQNNYRKSRFGKVQGFYNGSKNQAVLVAENLRALSAPAVLLHEIGVHMAYDTAFKRRMKPVIEAAPEILLKAARNDDFAAEFALSNLKAAGIGPTHPHYKEEACAYLVEACARKQATEPQLVRWFKQVKSTISVWMLEHGFKDCDPLSPTDLVTIAKSNVKEISKMPQELELSPKGREILAKHVQVLSSKYSKLSDAEAEIKGLYKQFAELEQAGKPLPEVLKAKKTKEPER